MPGWATRVFDEFTLRRIGMSEIEAEKSMDKFTTLVRKKVKVFDLIFDEVRAINLSFNVLNCSRQIRIYAFMVLHEII